MEPLEPKAKINRLEDPEYCDELPGGEAGAQGEGHREEQELARQNLSRAVGRKFYIPPAL